MKRVKRLLSMLLATAILLSMVVLPAGAVEINNDFAINIEVKTDSTQFENRDTLLVSLQAKTLNAKTISNTQSVVLACDLNLFDALATYQGQTSDYTDYIQSELAQTPTVVESTGGGFSAGYTSIAKDSEYIYYGIQPVLTVTPPFTSALDTQGDFVSLATIRLALKSGKSISDVTTNSIRLITLEEANNLHQNAIALLDDGTDAYIYGEIDGEGNFTNNDTLAKPTFTYEGFTPSVPAYTGEQVNELKISHKRGTVLQWQKIEIEGEEVEFAYNTSSEAPLTGWQTDPQFQNLPVGTVYFFARVKANENHQAGAAFGPKAVTIYDVPQISYPEIPAMTVGTPITPVEPIVTNPGAGPANLQTYRIEGYSLPEGLFLTSSTGVISGTPTAEAEAGQLIVLYTDQEGQSIEITLKYGAVSKQAGTLVITCDDVPYGTDPDPQPNAAETTTTGAVTYTYSTSENGTYGEWNTSNPVGTYYVKGKAEATENYAAVESEPVAFQVTPAEITGTVTIEGTATYGQTLTAKVDSNFKGTAAYQWYRGETAIDGATQDTYKLTAEDVGQTITVKVSDSAGNYSGTVESQPTNAVAKADASDSVTGSAKVISNTYDQNSSTAYTYALSGLTGLPADIADVSYGTVTIATNDGGLIADSPAPAVSDGSLTYTVTPQAADTAATITVVITSSNYNDITATITITSADKQSAAVTLNDATVTYNGQAQSLTPTWPADDTGTATKKITYIKQGESQATETAPKDAGTYTVTATYDSDTHYGTDTATLVIEPLEAVLQWNEGNLAYDGSAKNVTATVSNMVSGDSCDVIVTGGTETDAGQHMAEATVLSNANYKLPATATHAYTITPKKATLTVELSATEFEYNGSKQQPTVTAVKDGDTTLTLGDDYTVSIPESTNVGPYIVTVEGIGNYEGSTGEATYEITKQRQAALIIAGADEAKTYGDAAFDITVTGGSGEGAVTLTSSDPTILSLAKKASAADETWTATIHKAGTVTLTASKAGDANYKEADPVTQTVTIAAKSLAGATVEFKNGDTYSTTYATQYTGKEQTPEVKVTLDGTELKLNTDYSAKYTNNINVGANATVTITGMGNYQGTQDAAFEITAVDISDKTPTVTLTGEATTDGVLTAALEGVADSDVEWQWYYAAASAADVDRAIDGATSKTYVIADTDSNKAIYVVATAKADGNCTGTSLKSAVTNVAKATISGTVTITETNGSTGISGMIDEGDTLTATPNVTPAETNFTYQWTVNGAVVEDNTGNTYTIKEGDTSISVTATAAGDYQGSVTSATVEVGKITLGGALTITGTAAVGDQLTATYVNTSPNVPTADDYTIVWLRDGVEISGATGTTYTIAAADKGTTITAKAVAAGDTYTGEVLSNGIAVAETAPSAPSVTATAGDGKVTLAWSVSDNGGAPITGYTISYAASTEAATATTISVNAGINSCEVTGLTNGTEYTFKVTATNRVGTSAAGAVAATPTGATVPPPTTGGGSSGSGNSTVNGSTTISKPSTSGGETVVTTQAKPTVSGTTANVSISSANMDKAVESVLETAKKEDTAPVLEIAVDTPARVDSLKVELPTASLDTLAEHQDALLQITSNIGDVTLDSDAVYAIAQQAGSKVSIEISPVEISELNNRQQAAVGQSPVFDISIRSNGSYISSLRGGLATITLPHTLQAGQDPNRVVVYFLDDNGNITPCETVYNVRNKTVTFTTVHFSKYVIGYDEPNTQVKFSDVNDAGWAAPYIYDLCEKGIVDGVGGNKFAPTRMITRAEFVKILAGAAGVTKDDLSNGRSSFTDVERNSWYEPYVVWAVANNVTSGTSATTFSPSAPITREQMATMIYRFAVQKGVNLPQTIPQETFRDADAFSSWAVESIAAMQQAGIINGVGNGLFAPRNNATREQACKMISILLDITEG